MLSGQPIRIHMTPKCCVAVVTIELFYFEYFKISVKVIALKKELCLNVCS